VAAPGTAHRPSPAAAGPGFRPPARADPPGTTLQGSSSSQGDFCKIPGTRL
jgi:hypothetical protein